MPWALRAHRSTDEGIDSHNEIAAVRSFITLDRRKASRDTNSRHRITSDDDTPSQCELGDRFFHSVRRATSRALASDSQIEDFAARNILNFDRRRLHLREDYFLEALRLGTANTELALRGGQVEIRRCR